MFCSANPVLSHLMCPSSVECVATEPMPANQLLAEIELAVAAVRRHLLDEHEAATRTAVLRLSDKALELRDLVVTW